jgi:hypothetical protein
VPQSETQGEVDRVDPAINLPPIDAESPDTKITKRLDFSLVDGETCIRKARSDTDCELAERLSHRFRAAADERYGNWQEPDGPRALYHRNGHGR